MNDAVGLTVGKSLFLMGVSILILAVFLTLYMMLHQVKRKGKYKNECRKNTNQTIERKWKEKKRGEQNETKKNPINDNGNLTFYHSLR